MDSPLFELIRNIFIDLFLKFKKLGMRKTLIIIDIGGTVLSDRFKTQLQEAYEIFVLRSFGYSDIWKKLISN